VQCPHLTRDSQRVTELRFAGTKFSEHFRDGARLNAAVQQLVQFLGAGCYLNDLRSFLVKLGGCRESHGNHLDGFGLQWSIQSYTIWEYSIHVSKLMCAHLSSIHSDTSWLFWHSHLTKFNFGQGCTADSTGVWGHSSFQKNFITGRVELNLVTLISN